MEVEQRAVSPVSHVSLIQDDDEFHPQAIPMRIYRPDHIQQMPPWLREELAERKRLLNESREMDEANKLTEEHFGIRHERYDCQNEFVSEWLEGLPEKLVEGWETMLREAGERASSVVKHTSIIFEEHQEGHGEQQDARRASKMSVERRAYEDPEDEFLEKVLLGRKRLMQAEISVKRLKMGLKHVTNGACQEFGDEAAAGRTRDLLAAVDTTFEEVVRSRLSSVTQSNKQLANGRENYRERLDRLRETESQFMSRIYSSKEIAELKMMVRDILRMDEQSGESEGKQWFLRMLPRLLELREDIAQAEKETEMRLVQREASSSSFPDEHPAQTAENVPTDSEFYDIPVWDLYYHQNSWLQSEFGFQPTSPWEAFDISPEEEIHTEDWELRIEQRIWLQENFGLTTGGTLWTPFRLETAVREK